MRYIQKTLLCVLFWSFLGFTVAVGGQNTSKSSVQSKRYESYQEAFFKYKKDTVRATKIAWEWLRLAKEEQNNLEKAQVYKALMHVVQKEYRMIYADSLLAAALATKEDESIGGAYLTIGTAYYNQKDNAQALQNYLLAEKYIARTDDLYLSHKITYSIAQTNYHLGYYHEAIALFRKSLDFFKEENTEAYLSSLHGIGLCYHQIERYDLSSYHNQLGIHFSNEEGHLEMIPYFKNSEGFNRFKLGKHTESVALLTTSLPELERRQDHTTKALTLMYIGKYWLIKDDDGKAHECFLEVDEILSEHQIIHPYLRENFELLISFYKKYNDPAKTQYFSDKLIAFDNLLTKEFRNLAYGIHKKYTTTPARKANEMAASPAISPTYLWIGLLAVSLVGGIVLVVKKCKIKKTIAVKTTHAIVKLEELAVVDAGPLKKISLELQDAIVAKLVLFEHNQGFLEKGINLSALATALETNPRYASAIIAYHRGKNVSNYLNDLKIDYLINVLNENPNFRKFTNQVLSEKIGFGSTQIFTKAFNKRVGKSPNEYLKEL